MTSADSLLTDTILATPIVTRLALAAPNERLREQAASELARALIGVLEGSTPQLDARQIALPL